MEKIIAACGNDCSACPRYVKHPYEKTEAELIHIMSPREPEPDPIVADAPIGRRKKP